MVLIGIDPGTNTGVAVYCPKTKKLLAVHTLKIHRALNLVSEIEYEQKCILYIEDPNTWKPFGKNQAHKLQGAGSIKRDFAIWKDFCKEFGIKMVAVKIQGRIKKLNQNMFEKITGWKKRTSNHGRDAAMLVWDWRNEG